MAAIVDGGDALRRLSSERLRLYATQVMGIRSGSLYNAAAMLFWLSQRLVLTGPKGLVCLSVATDTLGGAGRR